MENKLFPLFSLHISTRIYIALITSSCDEYFAQSSANVLQIFVSPAFKCTGMIARNFSGKRMSGGSCVLFMLRSHFIIIQVAFRSVGIVAVFKTAPL